MTRKNDKPQGKATPEELARMLSASAGAVITTGDRVPNRPRADIPFPENSESLTGSGVTSRIEFYGGHMSHGDMRVSLLEDLPEAASELFPEFLGGVDDPSSLVFLDTETTGIGDGALAFLVGLGRIRPGKGFEVTQLFLESKRDEPNLLAGVDGYFSDKDVIVTYNGEYFDIPLLRRRYLLHGRPFRPGGLPHLDLLRPARSLWGDTAPNCRLKTLETEIFGFTRVGDVEGREIPGIYRDFLRTGRTGALGTVFTHNALDILSLAALLRAAAAQNPAEGVTPRPEEIAGRGLMHAKAGRSAQSVADLTQALDMGLPGKIKRKALKKLLLLHKKNGDHINALKAAEELMTQDPDGDPRPYLDAAAIHERITGDLDQAEAVIENALKTPRIPKDRETLENRLKRIRSRIAGK